MIFERKLKERVEIFEAGASRNALSAIYFIYIYACEGE